jgi:NADPH:quinone reductase
VCVRSVSTPTGGRRCSGSRRCTGERVLVTAAAGGVGHLAVQLAGVMGAAGVVAAIGRTAWTAKSDALRALGADDVVAYDEIAGGGQSDVDVALDGAGGPTRAACIAALAPWGRLVAYSGAGAMADVNDLRSNARTVIGFAMAHFAGRRPDAYARHRQELWDLHRAGRLRPLVDHTLTLEEATIAHRIIERRENVGRLILRP